ncbi:MAG: cbb3-type cytochrome c oxidase subunit 3 [candidate division Zixibacteria bacterium]
MIGEVLQTIKGIALFPTVSLVIFFGFFVSMIVWVAGLDKGYREKMKSMPLNEDGSLSDGDRDDG